MCAGCRILTTWRRRDRAIAHALSHPSRNLALAFLTTWPNLEAANRLVRAHRAELDGGDYLRLRPAAEILAEKYPVAATLLHRALADDVLRRASSRQYQYAGRDVRACAGLAARCCRRMDWRRTTRSWPG
jgi:hypothetical protein